MIIVRNNKPKCRFCAIAPQGHVTPCKRIWYKPLWVAESKYAWILRVSQQSVAPTSDSISRGPGFDTRSGHILSFLLWLIHEGQLSVIMCSKNWYRLGGLSLPRKSVVRLTGGPDLAIAVDRGRKTTTDHPIPNQLPCPFRDVFSILGKGP